MSKQDSNKRKAEKLMLKAFTLPAGPKKRELYKQADALYSPAQRRADARLHK